MPRYSYVALSPEYQKLTGVISANDEKDARQQLHSMHLSVVSISETNEAVTENLDDENQEGIETFYFKVTDQKGNVVDGTIDSVDRKTAYRRLVSEYHFKVDILCNVDIDENEREEKGREGLDQIAQDLKEEFGIDVNEVKSNTDQNQNAQYDENFNKKKDRLLKEVGKVCKKAEIILEEHSEKLSAQQDQIIRSRLDELMRMRLSNNLNHIESLTDDLFATITEVVNQNQLSDGDLEAEEAKTDTSSNDKDQENDNNNDKYNDAVKLSGLSKHFKNISDKFNEFLKPKKKKPKIIQKKSKGEFSKLIKEAYGNLKSYLFAKNKARRQESANNLKDVFAKFKELRKKKSSQKDRVLISSKDSRKLQRIIDTGNYNIFAEVRTLLGWLLGMYIFYFFFAYYVKFKWGTGAPLVLRDFVDNSIRTSFIFIIAGSLFILFLALSVEVKFDTKNILRSISIFLLSFVLIAFYIVNF